MAAKAKTKKKKRVYRCSYCGELGHNARTCPKRKADEAAKAAETTVTVTDGPDLGTPEEHKQKRDEIVKEVAKSAPVALSETVDLVQGHRKPNTRPVAPAAPYDCPTCERVGILVLVELADGAKALRCEHCQNKTPIKSILKWGALPSDKP